MLSVAYIRNRADVLKVYLPYTLIQLGLARIACKFNTPTLIYRPTLFSIYEQKPTR
jgi:hypothetical protein